MFEGGLGSGLDSKFRKLFRQKSKKVPVVVEKSKVLIVFENRPPLELTSCDQIEIIKVKR